MITSIISFVILDTLALSTFQRNSQLIHKFWEFQLTLGPNLIQAFFFFASQWISLDNFSPIYFLKFQLSTSVSLITSL